MEYLELEVALREVSGDEDKYRGLAGTLEQILKGEDTTPRQKARQLAKLVREGGDYSVGDDSAT